MLKCLCILIYYYLKTYIVGAWCLLKQLFSGHNDFKGIPLSPGKVAIVTGGSTGIGFHVSKGLVSKNLHVIIAGKSKEDGINAIKRIRTDYPNAKVDFMHLDLASLQSVKEFAEQFITRDLDLHVLVNNAGVMFPPYLLTTDGLETHLQVNFLAHFYLTELLMETMSRSGRENCWSRIVNVSSAVHTIAAPDLDRLGQRINNWYEYSAHKAYADSKLLVILGAYKLNSLLREDNIPVSVCAIHPGVAATGLWKHIHPVHGIPQKIIGPWLFWTPKQGADTILYAALSPEIEGQSGCYYSNSQKCNSSSLTHDKELQDRLWVQTDMLIKKAQKTNLKECTV